MNIDAITVVRQCRSCGLIKGVHKGMKRNEHTTFRLDDRHQQLVGMIPNCLSEASSPIAATGGIFLFVVVAVGGGGVVDKRQRK